MKKYYIASILAVVSIATAAAHPGGLDKDGGHQDKKTGSYHKHR